MKVVVIDLETTGLDPLRDFIVEVGIAMVDLETGITKSLFSSVCQEKGANLTGDEWIFKNSTLTLEMVQNAPYFVSIKSVIEALLNTFPATSYNQAFDFGFLESRGITIKKKFNDPMLVLTPIMELPFDFGNNGIDFKYPSLQEAVDYFFPNACDIATHRASSDAVKAGAVIYQIHLLINKEVLVP